MPEFREKVSFENVVAKHRTDSALLVELDDGQEVWFPLSQIDDSSEVFDASDNADGTLVVSKWIVDQKGLA